MPLQVSKPLSDIYQHALSLSIGQGIAEHKIKYLLSEITGIPIPALLLNKETTLTIQQEEIFNQAMVRLLHHEPVQYIINKTDFYGLELQVSEGVLIPRPETEGLVEWIVMMEKGKSKVLDIGTGSGAIALALKHLNPAFLISAVDVSFEALRIARRNCRELNLKISFSHADLFPTKQVKFDVIVSNPPYISTSEYYSLETEVQAFEPKLALHAGRDGLAVYRRILAKAGKYLNVNGKIYLEIGETQAKAIVEIAQKCDFSNSQLKQDLAGRDRYLCLCR